MNPVSLPTNPLPGGTPRSAVRANGTREEQAAFTPALLGLLVPLMAPAPMPIARIVENTGAGGAVPGLAQQLSASPVSSMPFPGAPVTADPSMGTPGLDSAGAWQFMTGKEQYVTSDARPEAGASGERGPEAGVTTARGLQAGLTGTHGLEAGVIGAHGLEAGVIGARGLDGPGVVIEHIQLDPVFTVAGRFAPSAAAGATATGDAESRTAVPARLAGPAASMSNSGDWAEQLTPSIVAAAKAPADARGAPSSPALDSSMGRAADPARAMRIAADSVPAGSSGSGATSGAGGPAQPALADPSASIATAAATTGSAGQNPSGSTPGEVTRRAAAAPARSAPAMRPGLRVTGASQGLSSSAGDAASTRSGKPMAGRVSPTSRSGPVEPVAPDVASPGNSAPFVTAAPPGAAHRTTSESGAATRLEAGAPADPRLDSVDGAGMRPTSGDQVTLRVEDAQGAEARLRVAVRGRDVRATIVTDDAGLARRLEDGLSGLRRSLGDRGFDRAQVAVHSASTARGDAAADSGRDQARPGKPEGERGSKAHSRNQDTPEQRSRRRGDRDAQER